ncbi:hypothetical protein [Streptomyces echinatus]|uniref:Uncharacterized protein n=1 Tax=Streptomyces echinatus TaxID=67293 RepID=A0A7W9UUX3_9ACTN|nr:hypothetical protein [Streptomyces echinatus]MBB5932160.1 hypothetical protein [Streptomyces echinatus]
MTYGTMAAPESNPRANAALADGCEVCNGWGSVITFQGRYELCQACQSPTERECHDSG